MNGGVGFWVCDCGLSLVWLGGDDWWVKLFWLCGIVCVYFGNIFGYI